MNAETIAHSLGKFTTKQGGGFMACCPAHQDDNPSLSVDDTDNGTILVKCWAGCTQDAVVSSLKDRGLWPTKDKPEPTPQVKSTVVARYHYRDQAGKVLYWKERLEPGRGDRKKDFRFRFTDPTTGKIEFGHGKHNPHVLYNLDKIVKASTVYFHEGEKHADVMTDWMLVGTTLDCGVQDVTANTQAMAEMRLALDALAGKNVALFQDNDDAGRRYMQSVARYLHGRVKRIKIIALPGLPAKGDICDWIRIEGNNKDAFAEIVKSTPEWEPTTQPEPLQAQNGCEPISKPQQKNPVREVTLIQGSTVLPENIEWAWNGWFPLGKLAILAGQPGTGKTTVMLAIATAITIGGRLADGTKAEVGSVVIWSGEDGISDTIVPRLIAMGADMTKIYFISGGDEKPFYPDQDMPLLAAQMKSISDAKLVIIDPVVSVISGDSHKNAEVRRGLQPLVDLGKNTGACIVGISHFNKGGNTSNPLDLISGSLAFAAVARVVLGAAKLQAPDPEHGHSRIFCRIKSNIGPDEDGIGYDLRMEPLADREDMEASTVLWGQYITGHSRDLLSLAQPDDNTPKANTRSSEAVDFLHSILSNGAVAQKTIEDAAAQAGIAETTLRRAKKTLSVVSKKNVTGWFWELPIVDAQIQDGQSLPQEKHGRLDLLGHLYSGNMANMPNTANISGEEIWPPCHKEPLTKHFPEVQTFTEADFFPEVTP